MSYSELTRRHSARPASPSVRGGSGALPDLIKVSGGFSMSPNLALIAAQRHLIELKPDLSGFKVLETLR
jgi:hypothetical protein